ELAGAPIFQNRAPRDGSRRSASRTRRPAVPTFASRRCPHATTPQENLDRPARNGYARRGSWFPSDQRSKKGFELQLRFVELASRIRVRHHAYACVEPRAILPQQPAPQSDRELAVAATVDPSDGACVPT